MKTLAINITEAMLDLMAEEPRKVADMADLIDCSILPINRRLKCLEQAGKVQRQRIINKKGYYFLWHLGSGKKLPTVYIALPEPDESDESDLEDDGPSAEPFIHKIVSTWAPLKLRCELETYLFGPALEVA